VNKACSKCGTIKELENFGPQKTGHLGRKANCKECHNKEHREYYEENKPVILKNHKEYKQNNKKKIVENNKKWHIKNKDRRKNLYLQREYNITLEKYNKIFIEQNGCCAICGIHQSQLNVSLHVDHNHINNEVRGLLCYPCNSALGALKADNGLDLLNKAIDYISKGKENAKRKA
jgi:hypothetical protein